MDPTDPMQPQDEEYDFKVLKELTTKSDIAEFNKKAQEGNNSFVIYFAHWCPHCKALTPELTKLDKFLSENKDKLKGAVARVSDEHVGELEVFNRPDGFPTIVVLDGKGEKKKDFTGSRTMKGFLEFLKSNGIYEGEMSGGKKKTKKSTKSVKKTNKKHNKTKKTKKHNKTKRTRKH
jgi:thiol-disulfide isomerase/thioredoxin